MKKLSLSHYIKDLIVTRGDQGALLYNRKQKKIYQSPAFTTNVIDKIGAGDAMLALISLPLKNSLDKNFCLFLGSLAAAQSVEVIGNSKSTDKTKLLKVIEHIA